MTKVGTAIAVTLGATTLISSAMLLVWDVRPELFPPRAHDYLAAFALAVIAVAWLIWQAVRRVAKMEFVKAILLAAAFLFWAANQLWPDLKEATLFNDIAVGLFVLDIFFIMIGWPSGNSDKEFAGSARTE
jgi:predicted membrane metal-binding protein